MKPIAKLSESRVMRLMLSYAPLLILWIVLAWWSFSRPTLLGDDAFFSSVLAGEKADLFTWWKFLIHRYNTWSSRSLIEGVLVIVARYPLLWKIGNVLVQVSITWTLSRLFNPEGKLSKNLIVVLAVAVYPLFILGETGYVATTLNYSWPLAAMLIAVAPLCKHFWGREVKRWECAVALIMLFAATFQELLAAVAFLAFAGGLVWRAVTEKRLPRFELAGLLISVLMLVWALTCPGNTARSAQEVLTWLPEYATLNLFGKIELGFSSTAKTLFLERNIFVLRFCIVLTVAVWLRERRLWARLLSLLPLAFVAIFGTFADRFAGLPPVALLRASVGKLGTGLGLSPMTWIPDLIFLAVFALLILSVWFAVKDRKRFGFYFFVLALGAASRMVMGISPTVWASGKRSGAFLYAAMAVVFAALVYDVAKALCAWVMEKRRALQ